MSEINDIVAKLKEADVAYYGDGTSPLTDKEYDELKDKLAEIDPDNPYHNEVGAEPIDDTHWEKHTHEYPLGSLNKVNSIDELINWAEFGDYVVQPKLDGISICLTYENGNLVRAVTRGKNGIGDDITRNVKKMKGVPKQLDDERKLVIRGEILMFTSDFENLPEDKRGKNPRNTAAGAAKKLSGDLCSYLTVMVYDLMNPTEVEISSEVEANKLLNDLDFKYVVKNETTEKNGLGEVITNMETERQNYEYDTDGLVIKPVEIDSSDDWERPKKKIAYKFAHQSARTTIREIQWVASGERVNPVALLEPVEIAGVTVSKASLHNVEYIKTLAGGERLHKGDEIEVSRRNDVIPQVEQVLKRNPSGMLLSMEPPYCPRCGEDVDRLDNDGKPMAWYVCLNPACPAKAVKSVLKWFEVHDCKGVAQKTVELIHENIGFDNLADFIDVIDNKEKELLALPGMGKSKLKKIREQLEDTKDTTISKFIGGMNFTGFGPKKIQKIVDYVTKDSKASISEILDISFNDLIKIEGFSDKSASAYKEQVEKSRLLMTEVERKGFRPSFAEKRTASTNPLAGTSFCFTGSLNTMKRKEAQELVESLGGEFKSGVASGLSYLVTNDPESNSSKNKKAKSLDVKIITEEEFLSLLKPIALLKSL